MKKFTRLVVAAAGAAAIAVVDPTITIANGYWWF